MAYLGIGFLLGLPVGFYLRVNEYQSPIEFSIRNFRQLFFPFLAKPEPIEEIQVEKKQHSRFSINGPLNTRTMADYINSANNKDD